MRTVTIRTTDLRTSVLGFGTAALTSLNDRGKALQLLNGAFEAGITHFDTARLYGYGHAEGLVGEFLRGRRERVTLTTKFGLEPPSGAIARSARIVSIGRAVARRVPFVAPLLRRRPQRTVAGSAFTPERAARSLETSLAQLGTDRIDLLLLH